MYHSAQVHELAVVDTKFLRFISRKFQELTVALLLISDCEKVWDAVEQFPYHFMRIIEELVKEEGEYILNICIAIF